MTDPNAEDGGRQHPTSDRTVSRRSVLAGTTAVGLGAISAASLPSLGAATTDPTTFSVTIENIGGGDTVNGTPFVLSPGAFASHKRGEPMFSDDEPERHNGLEEIAEDGAPGRLAADLDASDLVHDSGAFGRGPIGPGGSYEFSVEAHGPYRYLSLVTMFVQSNDLFYTLGGPGGLRLFDGDTPIEGDVTTHVGLWDAGTEINEHPGHGQNQAPRQSSAGIGLVERGTVVSIDDVNGYEYPAVTDVLKVTLSVD